MENLKEVLLFQNRQEFGEFWLEHSSPEKLFFMTLKNDAKFEEKLICGLENDIRNMANFHYSTWKILKLGLWWDRFI